MDSPDALLRSLRGRLAAPVALVWTENRAVYLSLRPRAGAWTLRLHSSFQEAPAAVWDGMERFLRTGHRASLGPARDHFAARRQGVVPRPRRLRLRGQGRVHDLGEILAEVSGHPVFSGLPPAPITWGRRTRPGRRQVRLGSYRPGRGGEAPLIRIHPLLDDPRVPRCVVAQVVHHELAHHLLAHLRGERAWRAHGRAFREVEARFADRALAQAWGDRHLADLLAKAGGRGGRSGWPPAGGRGHRERRSDA